MLDGDSWKNGDKPMATPKDMARFLQNHDRVLLDIVGYEHIIETSVMMVTPDGEYTKVVSGWGGGTWVRTQDCQVLSVLPKPELTDCRKATREEMMEILKDIQGRDDNGEWKSEGP